MKPIIREVADPSEITEGFAAAFGRLVPQLSRSAKIPTAEELAEIVRSPVTVLLVAYREGGGEDSGGEDGGGEDGGGEGGGGEDDRAEDSKAEIIGSLTLVLFRIPTGLRARIEDVVVDEGARGAGVGRALNATAMERAAAAGARSIDLTSGPAREAANELYLSLGFKQRDTNVYRAELQAN